MGSEMCIRDRCGTAQTRVSCQSHPLLPNFVAVGNQGLQDLFSSLNPDRTLNLRRGSAAQTHERRQHNEELATRLLLDVQCLLVEYETTHEALHRKRVEKVLWMELVQELCQEEDGRKDFACQVTAPLR